MRCFTIIITYLIFSNQSINAQNIYGCTYDSANNYNPQATHNDGSCCWIPNEFNGNTGLNMNVLFTESFLNDFPELVPNAYVVAFGSTSAIIIGSVNVYNTSTQSLILWGDDNFTSILDGAYENEFFWMQLVNGTDVYNIVDLVYGSGSNVYQTNSFSTILSGTFQLQCSIEDDSNLYNDNLIVTEINDPCMSLNEYNSILLELNPIQSRSFNEGWNMFGNSLSKSKKCCRNIFRC